MGFGVRPDESGRGKAAMNRRTPKDRRLESPPTSAINHFPTLNPIDSLRAGAYT